LVSICARKLAVRELEDRAPNTTVVSPIEAHDEMMALATGGYELRIFDLQQRLLESDEIVRLALEQPSERRHLDRFQLQRAIGEKQRHLYGMSSLERGSGF